ncbi:MAG: hypothetical protein HWE13_05915 [Gammaproteobacteria bacterium]|nr:hypothetical protein [Gammaproteobacteria bacterium]NVK87639.1 hypothetical protein [Gammaproteobacteria bacterium]
MNQSRPQLLVVLLTLIAFLAGQCCASVVNVLTLNSTSATEYSAVRTTGDAAHSAHHMSAADSSQHSMHVQTSSHACCADELAPADCSDCADAVSYTASPEAPAALAITNQPLTEQPYSHVSSASPVPHPPFASIKTRSKTYCQWLI